MEAIGLRLVLSSDVSGVQILFYTHNFKKKLYDVTVDENELFIIFYKSCPRSHWM